MAKYIIEIEDESIDGELYKAKGFNSLVFDQTGLNKLEKYEEPKEKASGRWVPNCNEIYHYIGRIRVYEEKWFDTDDDYFLYSIGNCFRTKKEAEFELERLKVIAELKEFAEGDDVWDRYKDHYFLCCNQKRELNISSNFYYKSGDLYFQSTEIAKKAIDTVGEDRIKKYYLRIEEADKNG